MPKAKTVIQTQEYIVKTPNVVGGSARLKDRRIPVWMITRDYYEFDVKPEEFLEMWEGVTLADIFAALAYYHDNKEEIDAEIDEVRAIEQEAREAGLLVD